MSEKYNKQGFDWNRAQGLKWVRRRKNGVSEWRGSWRNGPPLWFCRIFGAVGGLMFFAGVIGSLVTLLTSQSLNGFPVLIFVGLLYTTISAFAYKQRSIFMQLREPEQLAEQLGLSQEEIQHITEERDIKPKVYLNGIPLYNPDELVQAKVLLRASAEPVTENTLLRAASPALSATETEQLLRASTNE